MCDVCLCFVTFPYGVLSQVWYLIVSIPDLCLPSSFFVIISIGRSGTSTIIVLQQCGKSSLFLEVPSRVTNTPIYQYKAWSQFILKLHGATSKILCDFFLRHFKSIHPKLTVIAHSGLPKQAFSSYMYMHIKYISCKLWSGT